MPLTVALRRGLLAGALAGLLAGLAGLLFAEPTLDAAIALETGGGDELFSRGTQRLGLVLGMTLAGLALGALFALAYRVLPGVPRSPWTRSLALALGGFVALSLVPFLRYPANPPGVGDESTLDTRTSAYLLCIALGVAVASGAVATTGWLARRGWSAPARTSAVAVLAVVVVGSVYAVLPASAPSGDVPADLVWDFRLRSLGLQVLLYATLGAVFGALSERAPARPRTTEPVPV